jgi:N-acetylglucosamine-6-phosphate deacetylase
LPHRQFLHKDRDDNPIVTQNSSGCVTVSSHAQQVQKDIWPPSFDIPHYLNNRLSNMLIKFTNCRLAVNGKLIDQDLWIESKSGLIVDPQKVFYDQLGMPGQIFNLGGKIIAPGFIDIQINGAMGMDFSVPKDNPKTYAEGVKLVNRTLVKYGVTAYCPTVTSQSSDVYKQVCI